MYKVNLLDQADAESPTQDQCIYKHIPHQMLGHGQCLVCIFAAEFETKAMHPSPACFPVT
jgi:hypothetical protein